jgi:hypothetical protein
MRFGQNNKLHVEPETAEEYLKYLKSIYFTVDGNYTEQVVDKMVHLAMQWAIDQVIPEEKELIWKEEETESDYVQKIGFNACRAEILADKERIGL